MGACGGRLSTFPFSTGFGRLNEGVHVRFVGVGCFVVHFDGIGLLTDPFWSHLPLGKVAFGTIAPDPEQIEPYLPDLQHVQAVLVGHGHYDHVLDLPYVVSKLHPAATIIGSQTLKHTFAPMKLPRKWAVVNEHAATPDHPGTPLSLAGGRLRIRAIRSEHPNQYMGFHLFKHALSEERTEPPTRVKHYQEGMTLAYLVDWLSDEGMVKKRVYIQTSSTGYPAGFFPEAVLKEHSVDVALLPMDCANLQMKGVPTIIDFLRPTRVVFCHWEDFFRPKTKPPREIVKVNLPKLRESVHFSDRSRFFFPIWDSEYFFE